jgi:hypothetical protein
MHACSISLSFYVCLSVWAALFTSLNDCSVPAVSVNGHEMIGVREEMEHTAVKAAMVLLSLKGEPDLSRPFIICRHILFLAPDDDRDDDDAVAESMIVVSLVPDDRRQHPVVITALLLALSMIMIIIIHANKPAAVADTFIMNTAQ